MVRKVTWFMLPTTSATLIQLPIYTLVFQEPILFHFDSQRQHVLLHCDLQRQLTFSILTSRDNTLSLLYLTSSSQPHENVYSLQLFSSLFYLFGLTCYSLEHNHRNFVIPPKETNNQRGRRHVPPNTHY